MALIEACVYGAGRSSVNVRLRAFPEMIPTTGEREVTTESHSVYVVIDEDGEPDDEPARTVDSHRGERLRDRALAEERDRGDGI